VELLGWRVESLDQQRHGVDEHGRLTTTRPRDRTLDADDVAEVEHRHHRMGIAGAIGAKPRLQAARLVLDVRERRAAEITQLHDPSSHGNNRPIGCVGVRAGMRGLVRVKHTARLIRGRARARSRHRRTESHERRAHRPCAGALQRDRRMACGLSSRRGSPRALDAPRSALVDLDDLDLAGTTGG